jgi:hypothetical protein
MTCYESQRSELPRLNLQETLSFRRHQSRRINRLRSVPWKPSKKNVCLECSLPRGIIEGPKGAAQILAVQSTLRARMKKLQILQTSLTRESIRSTDLLVHYDQLNT